MATGGALPSAIPSDDRRQSLICSLCLEVFRNPRLLPNCHHTFCLACLEDLTSRPPPRPTYPCPQCRREFTVPSEGLAAFQTNFYLHPEDLDKARDGVLCLVHPKQDLELFCVDCQLPVCPKCVLEKHRSHKTQSLAEAASEASDQLSGDQLRLEEAVSDLIEKVEAVKTQQRDLLGKKAAVGTGIVNKHALLVKAANAYRDGALASLDECSERLEAGLAKELDLQQRRLERVCQLQEDVEEAVKSGANKSKLVLLAKEMRSGRGSPESLAKLAAYERKSDVCSLKLWSDFPQFHFRHFLNTVSKFGTGVDELTADSNVSVQKGDQTADEEPVPLRVIVEKQFDCGKDRKDGDTEIFFLCPLDDGSVLVSYAQVGSNKNAPSEKFEETGKSVLTLEKTAGKVSFVSIGDGLFRHLLPVDGFPRVFCKFRASQIYFRLDSSSVDGKATITKVQVTSKSPFKADLTTEFNIKLGGLHARAFDVNDSEQLFAVVEESEDSEVQRKVRLFRRPEEDAVATYTSPLAAFQPSDVCFFRMGGQQQLLLVANEMNDCVHVVDVEEGALTFLRYLAAGCPFLIQPTALNTDSQGRLWLACRGGNIFTMRMAAVS